MTPPSASACVSASHDIDENDEWLSTPEDPADPGQEIYSATDNTTTLNQEGSPSPQSQELIPRQISCTAKANDPHDSSHINGTENSQLQVKCSGAVASVTAYAQTLRDGSVVGMSAKLTVNKFFKGRTGEYRLNFAVKCVPGHYQTNWYAFVTGGPNYTPSVGPLSTISSKTEYVACTK